MNIKDVLLKQAQPSDSEVVSKALEHHPQLKGHKVFLQLEDLRKFLDTHNQNKHSWKTLDELAEKAKGLWRLISVWSKQGPPENEMRFWSVREEEDSPSNDWWGSYHLYFCLAISMDEDVEIFKVKVEEF